MGVVGRFAPSPTGVMHAGNIFAALNAWLVSKSQDGRMVMRIEDLDSERSRAEYADGILRDFESLGLTWDEGPFYQHDRQEAYEEAFQQISSKRHVYPCFCTRADIAAQSAPHGLGEKPVYGGRCRNLNPTEALEQAVELAACGRRPSYRLEVDGSTVAFDDLYQGRFSQVLDAECGDFVLKRADGGFAYQLAVVVDDAEQGVNSVVRGYDLLPSTPQQMHLQDLLGMEHPAYAHFPLFCAKDGRRLAKRNKAASYPELLDAFGSPEAVIGHVAYMGGLAATDEPTTPERLLESFDISEARKAYQGRISYEFDVC